MVLLRDGGGRGVGVEAAGLVNDVVGDEAAVVVIVVVFAQLVRVCRVRLSHLAVVAVDSQGLA